MIQLNEFLRHLDGVTQAGTNSNGKPQYMARCPAHDDRKASLSVSEGNDGRVLCTCQAGCSFTSVVSALGYKPSELMPDKQKPQREMKQYPKVVDTYQYTDTLIKERLEPKSFRWKHLENGKWIYNKGTKEHYLYQQGNPAKDNLCFICEGEKDAKNWHSASGKYCVSSENGAGNAKWYGKEYNPLLAAKYCYLLPDNDETGYKFMEDVASELYGKVKSIRILKLVDVYPDLPKKGDISDLIELVGEDKAITLVSELMAQTEEYQPIKRNAIEPLTPSKTIQINQKLIDLHPEDSKNYQRTDIGNGKLFADVYRDSLIFIDDRRVWYGFNGKRWIPDANANLANQKLKELANSLLAYSISLGDEDVKLKFIDYYSKWQKKYTRNTIIKDAESENFAHFSIFDSNPNLFNCINGTLDLDSLEFKDHDSKDYLSMMSGVRFDASAACLRWEIFIDEVTCGDKEKARYLQKLCGYCLTGNTEVEAFWILLGKHTRNGKGTFCETIKALMGDYGVAVKPESIAQKDKSNGSTPSEDIARLAGKRFANVSEPDKRMVFSVSLVKTLTGRDTITARYLHENSFEFRPQFKMIINSNHSPQVTDDTLFTSGRVNVISFDKHFDESERDEKLKDKLTTAESLSGILNWAIEGYKLYKAEGLHPPECVRTATKAYQEDNDKISQFFDEEIDYSQGYRIRLSNVYAAYKKWCENNGFCAGSCRTFKTDIEKKYMVISARPSSGGDKTTCIENYNLKHDTPPGYTEISPLKNEAIPF